MFTPECNVVVRLDDPAAPGAVLRPGDVVQGTVTVVVHEPVRCEALVVAVGWRTHGRGNKDVRHLSEATVFTGDFQPGTETFRFEAEVPEGPATYHGRLVHVEWFVEARADVPWAIDPRGRAEIVVEPVPSPEGPMLSSEGTAQPNPQAATHEDPQPPAALGIAARLLGTGCALLFILPFALVGVGVLAAGIHELRTTGDPGAWVAILVGLVFAGVGLLPVLGWVRRSLAQRKAQGALRAEPGAVRRGNEVTGVVTFADATHLDLTDARLTLRATERATSGSGTSRHTYTETVWEAEAPLEVVRPQGRAELRATIAVPADAPLSFRSSNNAVTWTLGAHLEIPRWPDWVREVPVAVRA